MKEQIRGFLQRKITKEECKDTGMAMVLLALLFAVSLGQEGWLITAIVLLLIDMTAPQLYRPVAVLWLGLSGLLGTVMSRVLLTLVFFVIVTPIGLVRRALGMDSLQMNIFQASDESVMRVRDHTFTSQDITKPY